MSSAAKMSVEVGDVQSDEDCEDLAEDGLSFSADPSEKARRKRSSGKPPLSPRSPYLSTINMNPRRAAVAAWRLPRASLGDTRGDTPGEMGSSRHTSLTNGHDLSQTLRSSEGDVTSEFLKQTLAARKHKHLHSASNGFTSSDYRTKEDMYEEIIRLKKNLHEHKSDNLKMKAKVRRLEEDNAKREKQLEELLDPKKGSDYARSLVDKKKEGSVVINGLKQRILKLEQQCREKENALSKLQSELRTTNLEELKITVDTYFEEIQRLRMLLESTEKSSRAESKCSQRQQKALSSTVVRLSESLKQLQQENTELRTELNTDSPAGGVKGYREWSKQRMLRRLFELEKRLEEVRRPTPDAKTGSRLDREVQTTPPESLVAAQEVTVATEARVSTGVNTEEWDGTAELRGRIGQLEAEGAELRGMLTNRDDELKQLKTEREEAEKETERRNAEREKELDGERQQRQQELEHLRGRIQTLEAEQDHLANSAPLPSPPATQDQGTQTSTEEGVGGATGGKGRSKGERHRRLGRDAGVKTTNRNGRPERRDEAARIIQTKWREHRQKDMVMLQSALRGHLLRESQLKDLLRDPRNEASDAMDRGDGTSCAEVQLDAVAVTMIQSAIRGHLARCGFDGDSSGSSVPFSAGDSLPALMPRKPRSLHTASKAGSAHGEKRVVEDHPWPVSSAPTAGITPTSAQSDLPCTAEPAVDSDDSDDIIVSPSRPLRSREVLIL